MQRNKQNDNDDLEKSLTKQKSNQDLDNDSVLGKAINVDEISENNDTISQNIKIEEKYVIP